MVEIHSLGASPPSRTEVMPMHEVKCGIFSYSSDNYLSSATRQQQKALKNEHLILVVLTLMVLFTRNIET